MPIPVLAFPEESGVLPTFFWAAALKKKIDRDEQTTNRANGRFGSFLLVRNIR
jgi:hypothetical protein